MWSPKQLMSSHVLAGVTCSTQPFYNRQLFALQPAKLANGLADAAWVRNFYPIKF